MIIARMIITASAAKTSSSGITRYEDLPAAARDYIAFLPEGAAEIAKQVKLLHNREVHEYIQSIGRRLAGDSRFAASPVDDRSTRAYWRASRGREAFRRS